MKPQSLVINTPRGTFAARALGQPDAPLVLCLHGFPDDASTFDELLDSLAQAGLRAVAPFCRGYAPSPLANPDGSSFGKDLLEVLAADALALADALSLEKPVHLVATTMVALRFTMLSDWTPPAGVGR
jgi:pimeloyl-ACP methyl ester carboxylesterase